MQLKFIENHKAQLLPEIESLLAEASEVCFAVAFVRESGVDLISDAIRAARSRGARVRILFGADWALTEPNAIQALAQLGVDVRCYSSGDTFHPKGYVFRRGDDVFAIVGSSNLSASGLTRGREWSVLLDCAAAVIDEFDRLWNSDNAKPVTEALLRRLEHRGAPPDLREILDKEDSSAPLPPRVAQADPSGTIKRAPIEFLFTVNKSFRSYGNHPITVPKAIYPRLRAEGLDRGNLAVVFADSDALSGYMHSATAGYGPYHQIRISGRKDHPLFTVRLGTALRVRCERGPDETRWVRITQ